MLDSSDYNRTAASLAETLHVDPQVGMLSQVCPAAELPLPCFWLPLKYFGDKSSFKQASKKKNQQNKQKDPKQNK